LKHQGSGGSNTSIRELYHRRRALSVTKGYIKSLYTRPEQGRGALEPLYFTKQFNVLLVSERPHGLDKSLSSRASSGGRLQALGRGAKRVRVDLLINEIQPCPGGIEAREKAGEFERGSGEDRLAPYVGVSYLV